MSASSPTTIIPRLLSNTAFNGMCYIAAQGINLVIQLLLVRALGTAEFGVLGVVQLCVTALIFVAELGTPSYFIRAASTRENWGDEWRMSVRYRRGLVCIGILLLLGYGYGRQGFNTEGVEYLLATIPAMLLSASNPAPILIAQAHTRRAAIGLVVLWGSYALLATAALQLLPNADLPLALGAAFSVGYAAMGIFYRQGIRWPDRGETATKDTLRAMRKSTFIVWLPGLLGTAYGLQLTFMVEHMAPILLTYFILGNQILQGISGINNQLQRSLLSVMSIHHHQETHEEGRQLLHSLCTLAAMGALAMVLALMATLLATGAWLNEPVILDESRYFSMMLADRFLGLVGAFLVTALVACHREGLVLRTIVYTYGTSMLLQWGLAEAGVALLPILLLRLVTILLQMAAFYRALALRPSWIAALGLSLTLAMGAFHFTPFSGGLASFSCLMAALACVLTAYRRYRQVK